MSDYLITYSDGSEKTLMHYGVQGMKWGIRRYQNPDGSLTAEGKQKYGVNASGRIFKKASLTNGKKKYSKEANQLYNNYLKGQTTGKTVAKAFLGFTPLYDKSYGIARQTGHGRVSSALAASTNVLVPIGATIAANAAGQTVASLIGVDSKAKRLGITAVATFGALSLSSLAAKEGYTSMTDRKLTKNYLKRGNTIKER